MLPRLALSVIALILFSAGSQAMEAKPVSLKRDGSKVWLDGVESYRVIDPVFEGVRLILASRGDRYSPDYIQGISGSAFRIGGICPCAPTCDNAMWPEALLQLLGYEFEHVKVEGKDEALTESTAKAVARVKQEIDAGRAALVWHAFTNAEWDVVYGYDADKKEFLGRGSYAGNDKPFAAADETRTGKCGEICDPCGVILIGRKTGQLDAPKAEIAALKEAVRHGRDQKNVDKLGGEKWVMLSGIACYDRWIRDFGKPDHKRGVGDSYCYGVYRSTHAAAAGFLREIAPKHPAMADRLKRAADHFQAEAEALAKCKKLLWWDAPEGPDPKRNAEAATLLKQARDAYAAGIAEIKKALDAEETARAWSESIPGQVRPAALERLRIRDVATPDDAWGACLPRAIVRCLEHRGAKCDYAELTAGSGWAFSFSYKYDSWHVAGLGFWHFDWLPKQLGYDLQKVGCGDRGGVWDFVKKHVDAEVPVACTLGDGGLVYGYREKDGQRQVWFEGEPIGVAWFDIAKMHPFDECAVLVKARPARPQQEIVREALARAARFAVGGEHKGVPQGVAALEAYLADVKDPAKSFEGISEWFCWATFERLSARKCCAIWLRHAADVLGGKAREPLLAAAGHYEKAFGHYVEYDREVHGNEGKGLSWHERFRTPERIAVLSKLLEQGIAAERAGIAELERAVALTSPQPKETP